MKVLITGALGFVGKNLVEFLKTKEEIELLLYDKDNSIRYKKCEEEEKTAIKIDVRLGDYIKIQDLKEISVKMNLFNNGEFMEVNRVYNIKKVKNKRTVLPQIVMEIRRR